jgi:nicotinate-nucleotide adenylyltransferase
MTPRLLYGGTFDPVHLGHLQVARTVARRLGAPVHLLPSADPPHRAAPGATAAQRARMLELAIAGDPALRLDARELRRAGPSYTVDTLAEVRAEVGPDTPVVWVLGIDSVLQLPTWHGWERLPALANLLGVQRPGTQVGQAWLAGRAPAAHALLAPGWTTPERLLRQPAGAYAALALRPLRRESASDVRARLASGGDWQSLVPPAVAAFIAATGLYGGVRAPTAIIEARRPPPSEDTR